LLSAKTRAKKKKEMKRFSHQKINQLWQTDILYGPHLKLGRAKKRTYLIAYIDDASRIITHARFNWEQNFVAIRDVFKEAVFKARNTETALYRQRESVSLWPAGFNLCQLGVQLTPCGTIFSQPKKQD